MIRGLLFLVCGQLVAGTAAPPEVTLGQGRVRGLVQQTITGRSFNAFVGIPYAKPPVGENRFKPAVPSEQWSGLWNATVQPNACTQVNFFTVDPQYEIIGSEDCLYVNVYTPKLPDNANSKPLDVLVFIHGGGFQFLTGAAYGPEYILDRDVVYVTLNYRLGILGFLSLEDDVLPGNNGLKDQTLALKWIKKNVAAFGGDPNKITISGMSAGGASVHYHILSKQSKGLFNKAITNSGAAGNPWAVAKNPREKALRVAAGLGCPTDCSKKLVDCLRERPAEAITRMIKLFQVIGGLPVSPIGPVIEKPSPTAFIDSPPNDLIKNKEYNDVPMLWSYNSEEGLFPGAALLSDESGSVDAKWDELMPHLLELNYTVSPQQQLQIVHQIREHYLGGKKIREVPEKLTELLGDRYFFNDINTAIRLHAEHGSSPVWMYKFSYVGVQRLSNFNNIGHIYKGGACHGDDTHYVLRASYMPVDGTPDAIKMIKTTTDLWIQFIKGAIPTSWKPVKSGLPDLTFLNVVCTDPANNVLKTAKKTPGQELWESFRLPENSLELIKSDVRHNEL